MDKSLDQKLARIAADPSCNDFILADAKDPDLAFGLMGPGPAAAGQAHPYRTLDEFRDLIREIVDRKLVDIMLMSASTSEILTIEERIFDESPVTPAARANDTTDIWFAPGSHYRHQPSLPFSSTTIDHIQAGKFQCRDIERTQGANLGLYSITLNNDAHRDAITLEHYKQFRLEAEQKGFRHFLEVFAPNALVHPVDDIARYVNDCIVRLLGGITRAGRPLFLKMPYFGPAAMEALVRYDSSLVVGILGGSAGTTMDAFRMLADAKKYGARVALFGRKINNAEDQIAFLGYLRQLADGAITAEEAVRAYHGDLQTLGKKPHRDLADDLLVTHCPI